MPRRGSRKQSSLGAGCAAIFIFLVVAGICSSIFSSGSSSEPTRVSTRIAVPTERATSQPKLVASPTKIPTKKVISLRACANTSANVRQGPGTDYAVIGGVVSGSCVTIIGRNDDRSWAHIETDDSVLGWISAPLLDIDGDIKTVSVSSYVAAVPTVVPQSSDGSGGASSPSYPVGATAICMDGTYSYSANRRGTCSHHGGVAQWLP